MDRKTEILEQYFGYTEFREGQETLIEGILEGRDVLGIMPTGSGKSICYQVPALMLEGVTVVISPLISLMKDQVAALKNAGVAGAYINSSLTAAQTRTVYKRVLQGMYKIIYVAPERLETYDFQTVFRQIRISMIAVDEAHCISQWGQDFRPSYLRIVDFLKCLDYRPVLSAFTATATGQVAEDIVSALQLRNPVRLVTGFDRPNLRFSVLRPKVKLDTLLELVRQRAAACGIIYCATRKDTDKVAQALRDQGYSALPYHAGLPEEVRRENQEDFIYDRCRIMVATNAFGMGINKSNVSYVIHYNMPKCVEAYYQEAGRAGRDGTAADCILLFSIKDVQTAKFLIETPTEGSDLTLEQSEWILEQDFKRLEKMVGYCTCTGCLRGYILDYFGQTHGETCGNCSSCLESWQETDITDISRTVLTCMQQIRQALGYNLGQGSVIHVLRGSREKRLKDLGLHELGTYASLPQLKPRPLEDILNTLKEQGLLRQNFRFGTLELTGAGAAALEAGKTVTMRVRGEQPAQKVQKPEPGTAPGDGRLLERLKALRMKLAAREKVPAYIIFSNATLQDMAQKQPGTLEEFLEVSGVGQYKAHRYGEAFLTEIRRYLEKQA